MVDAVDESSERYRLETLLGRGGMGEVYRAYDRRLDRYLALKLLPANLSQDENFVARFRREAQIAARLDEPHVVPIYDFGEMSGRLFIAMRLVDGTDVAQMLREGPLAMELATHIVSQVAGALDAAHRADLVHRDVKPSNIMVTNDGQTFAYLMDFGVAVEAGRSGELTSSDTPIGTLNYMAPEIFTGANSSRSVDVYSLGCVLYEMLVGRRPFAGGDLPSVMRSHLMEPPPRPSAENAKIPSSFDEVIARAMAKSPEERYRTAGDLARAALEVVRASGRSNGTEVAPQDSPPIVGGWLPVGTASRSKENTPAPDLTRVTRPPPKRPFDFLPPRVGRLPLHPDYQTTSGPLRHASIIPFLNNQPFVDTVRQRLHYSPGGSLLVTGLNGVGKTTVVRRAIDELRQDLVRAGADERPVIEVWQSVARPATPDELIVRLLRGLAESIHRAGIMARLPSEARETLEIAYSRTLMTVKSTRSEATESSLGVTGTVGALGGNVGGKRTRSYGNEEQFLPYGLLDAEHDFIRIVTALFSNGHAPRGVARRWFSRTPRLWTGRLVIVLDEIDKLTSDPEGLPSLEALLRGLKNVLTASGAHFVFIAGADVFDLSRHSHARGHTIWSTVFGRQLYINCLPPGAAGFLLRHLLTGMVGRTPTEIADYLEYRSRGLPRLLLNDLDELVQWHPDGPHITIDHQSALSIAFYASLQRRLGPLWAQARPRGPLTDAIDIDSRRNSTYLVVNWVLSRRGAAFTAADLLNERAGHRLNVDLASDAECVELLRELTAVGVLDAKEPNSPEVTFIGKEWDAETRYQLARTIVDAVQDRATESGDLGRVDGDRYVLVEELGRGPLGRVFRAHDTHTGRDVAVKVLDSRAVSPDDDLVERFRREVEIARRLDHPSLAAVLAAVDDDGQLALVSEYVTGQSLAALTARGPLQPAMSAGIARALAELLRYLDGQGVVRVGLKPSNIIITPDGQPVLVDLGLARGAEDAPLTSAGVVVGTPLYLAPEQFARPGVDIAADLFALGLVLYEMVAGYPARRGDLRSIMDSMAAERILVDQLPCSPQLRDLVAWLLEPNTSKRCRDPGALSMHLSSVPELRV